MSFSISKEKELVKQASASSLVLQSKWQVVSMLWINKWKAYVGFEMEYADERTEEVSIPISFMLSSSVTLCLVSFVVLNHTGKRANVPRSY